MDNSEIAFGATLADLPVMHVPYVVQSVAAGASAEETCIGEGGGARLLQASRIRHGLPAAKGDPRQFRLVRMGPVHGGDLEDPVVVSFHAMEVLV